MREFSSRDGVSAGMGTQCGAWEVAELRGVFGEPLGM